MSDSGENTAMANGAFREEERIGIRLWQFTPAGPGVHVYFTCRRSGVSKPPYDTLNLGFHVDDDPGCVHKNRQLLGRALKQKASIFTSPRQRHSAEVVVLDNELLIGAGSTITAPNPFDPCDAMVTSLQGAPVLLHFADCVPVVLTGKGAGKPVIGVVHAGRRSLVAGVVGNSAAAMAEMGVEPQTILVAIGPAIGPCCYEVDRQTAAEFSGRFGADTVSGGRLDLKAGVVSELVAAGVPEASIHNLDICTCCDGDFFSYRRDGPVTGRQGAVVWLD